jgi:hypothetical protein
MGYAENLAIMRQWQTEAKPIEAASDGFDPGCTGKIRHPTKAAAIVAAKIIGRGKVRPYVCRCCGGWHTGSK